MTFFAKMGATLAIVIGATSANAACNSSSTATIAANIAHGHAYTKHAAEFVHGTVIDGLAFPGPTIANADEFATFLQAILDAPSDSKVLANSRSAYWATPTGTVIIVNLNVDDCGTAFRPIAGKQYYDSLS